MQLVYLFLIIVILIGFVALVVYLPRDTPSTAYDEATQLITQFTKSGEYIGFDADPTPPTTTYTYKPRQNIITVTLSNGTKVNQTETTYEKIEQTPTTTLDLNIQDRRESPPKICKFGYQCDVTGTINLIDPVTKKKISPPYSFLITIGCDYRDFCNLSPTLSKNSATFPDGTFKYTWIPVAPVTIGDYEASVYVTSYYTNENGENERRLATRMIQVVP